MMARIPSSLLRQRAVIDPYEGETGDCEPTYGEPVADVKTRVEGRRRRVVRANGVEVVTVAAAFIRPEVRVGGPARVPAPEDRFTCDDRSYEIVEVLDGQGLSHPTHRELLLVPAKAAA